MIWRPALFIFALIITTSCSENQTSESSSFEQIKSKLERGESLKVGYTPYEGITSLNPKTGKVEGFLVDLTYEVVKPLGVKSGEIEFVQADWKSFWSGLYNNRFDFSVAGTFITPARIERVDFTDPIFYLGSGAVARKGDRRFEDIKGIQDLDKAGLTIAVVAGEFSYEYAQDNFKNAELLILTGSDLNLAPLAVLNQKADVAMSDQYILSLFVSANDGVEDVLKNAPYSVLPISWAVAKGDEKLLTFLNGRLSSLKQDETIARIQVKYDLVPFVEKPNE